MAARKSLGQNFLVDRGAVRRIVESLALRPGEPLLEIGPGRGALTADLLHAAGRMAAVELDADLARALERSFDTERLVLLHDSILRLELTQVLTALEAPADARLVIAGNLPYNVSKPIAQKLIRDRSRVDRAVLMFQQEVARRLTARPGSRDYGPLTVLAGRCYEIERLFDLPPRAFAPRPKVTSTVTRWVARTEHGLGLDEEVRLRGVLEVAFARRRKTLRNNLRAALCDPDRVERLLDDADLDGNLRAEALRPPEFERLATLWGATSLL